MTVATDSSRKTFTGDAVTTSFATSPVVFFETSNLVVSVVTTATGAATTLTENTHYTVSGGDGSTGTVDLSGGSAPYGAPSAAQTLVIVRDLPLTQSADPDNGDNSDAEVIEEVADRLTMMAQQLQRQIDGAFRLADTDVSGADATIPTPVASRLIGWNSGATALQNYAAADLSAVLVTPFAETVLDDTDAATARTTLGAAATASANTFTADQTIKGTTDSTAVGPTLELYRSRADGSAGADSDTIGAVLFTGNDDAGTPAKSDYARIAGSIVDSGAGSEDGQILFHTATNGTLAQRARITTGLVMGNPTGGDKGVGTVNATAMYINNVAVQTVVATPYDSGAQTITAGGLLTLAHGLGAAPVRMRLLLRCNDAGGEGGWAQNDEFEIDTSGGFYPSNYGCVTYSDATNVYVRIGSTAVPFYALNKSSGASVALTNTKWNLIVKAYL